MAIVRLDLDFDTGELMIAFADGSVRQEMLGDWPARRSTNIRQYRLDLVAGLLCLGLPNGRLAVAELSRPRVADSQLLAERAIVYLDQNLWSRLAAARHGHRPVDGAEAAAAETLAELVAERRIILPVSSSHLLETTRHRGPNRLPLASTLLELCRGWQMRHPGVVGLRELAGVVNGWGMITRADVFTLEPHGTVLTPIAAPPPRLPQPWGSLVSHLSAVSGTYDAVIDDSALLDEGAEIRQRWAAAHDDLVKMMTADQMSDAEGVTNVALARLLVDYAQQVIRDSAPQFDLETFKAWLPQARQSIARLPYLGRLWRLTFARLRNRARWRPNDLADIHFLAAAAGYADVVAGERRTISDLASAKGIVTGARLAKNLRETVGAVEEVLSDSGGGHTR